MFGLEAWHLWAIGSVLAAGAFSFLAKIAAERGHAPAFFNAVSAAVAAVISVVMVSVTGYSAAWLVVLLAVLDALFFIYGTIARSEALEYVHTTIYFPLYKVIGPTIVLVGGILLFGERLTEIQYLGFLLVISVPLLLIGRAEKVRQKDLARGIRLTIWSALLISVGHLMSKAAAYSDAATYGFLVINYVLTALGAGFLYARGKRKNEPDASRVELYAIAGISGIFQFCGFAFLMLAYRSGPISTVYAINSTYIIIPIVLSIIFYGEHWNARKVAAVALSVVAVVLLR